MVRYNEKTNLTSKQLRDFAESLRTAITTIEQTAEAMDKLSVAVIHCRNFSSGTSGAEAVYKFSGAVAESIGRALIGLDKAGAENAALQAAEETVAFKRQRQKKGREED